MNTYNLAMVSQGLHLAIIMDGNGRWSKQHNKSRSFGHKKGAETLISLLEQLPEDVYALTVYAFSIENWSRSFMEVYQLLKIAQNTLHEHLNTFIRLGIKVQFIGNIDMLPGTIISSIQEVEAKTKHCSNKILNIAVSYGSRQEIVTAINKCNSSSIDIQALEQQINPTGLRDPDILIRTGGEKRLSNYLLWQLAYTELFFIDTLWPDFNIQTLNEILSSYYQRNKNYGFAVESKTVSI